MYRCSVDPDAEYSPDGRPHRMPPGRPMASANRTCPDRGGVPRPRRAEVRDRRRPMPGVQRVGDGRGTRGSLTTLVNTIAVRCASAGRKVAANLAGRRRAAPSCPGGCGCDRRRRPVGSAHGIRPRSRRLPDEALRSQGADGTGALVAAARPRRRRLGRAAVAGRAALPRRSGMRSGWTGTESSALRPSSASLRL